MTPLYTVEGKIVWDFSVLLHTILGKRWDNFVKYTKRSRQIADQQQLWLAIKELINLRDRSLGHRHLGDFTEEDLAGFLYKAQLLLRTLGAEEAADKIDEMRDERSFKLQQVKTEFKNAASMLGHPVIYEFLEEECTKKSVFPGVKLEMLKQPIGSRVIPMAVAVFAKGVQVRLGKLDTTLTAFTPNDLATDEYIKRRDKLIGNTLIGKPDRLTYTARKIQTGGFCEIEGGVTTYLSGLKVHHALQHELLMATYSLQAEGKLKNPRALESRLVKRSKFFESSEADQLWYRPISISALIIHNTEGEGYKIMIRKRSTKVAVDPNMLQAIPSFTFQSDFDKKKEWDVTYCVRKEYAEELFDKPVDEIRAETPEDLAEKVPQMMELNKALQTGQCELLYSGVVLDLMLLFPEIFCVLLVHDSKWFREQQLRFKLNNEFKTKREMLLDRDDEVLLEYHLEDAEDEFLDYGRKSAEDIWRTWSRFGMSSFWLGVETARQHLVSKR